MSDYSIYVVVREDLEPGRAVAQVAHAVAGLVHDAQSTATPEERVTIFEAVHYGRMIVLGGVHSQYELAMFGSSLLQLFCPRKGMIRINSFIEPDLDNQMTATAFLVKGPIEEALFANLPLAFRPPKPIKRRWWHN